VKRNAPSVEFITLPDSLSNLPNVIDRRTLSLFRTWSTLPDMDLRRLIHAVYLQGVSDGVAAMERQAEKESNDG